MRIIAHRVSGEAWKGRFHIDQVTAMGHSFGAATTVGILREKSGEGRFAYCAQGVIYDPWAAAIRSEPGSVQSKLDSSDKASAERPRSKVPILRPTLCINSEAFAYWSSNFALVRQLISSAISESAASWLLTIRGTVHLSQSDFAILYPRLCSMLLKMTAEPRRALDINVDATLEFLCRTLSKERTVHVRRVIGKGERILDMRPLEREDVEEADLHQPKDKWIAARLQIPHEAYWRLNPRLALRRRKMPRRGSQRRRQSMKAMGDTWFEGFGKPENEVWMVSTTCLARRAFS